jgi:O-acetyl-ADP-ribose deacetylase (regulator of RNase III)
MIVCSLCQPSYRTLVRVGERLLGPEANVTIAIEPTAGGIIESVRQVLLSNKVKLSIVQADITQLGVEAIVNAANASLQHGGGVAAAIVRAGGATIQAESNRWVSKHGEITAEQPALTTAGNLPARFVIHAVGPIWGEGDEPRKLDRAVTSALQLAEGQGLHSLALPAISTGIYRFPVNDAAEIILDAIARFATTTKVQSLKTIILALWDQTAVAAFSAAFDRKWASPGFNE